MLGRRSAQAGLFDAGSLLGADQVSQIPFYGRMAANWRQIFRDEQFAELYAKRGRNSVPPSILATATVLQRFEDISDEEVVERTKYDLRWKAVFDTDPCSLRPLFAKSSLQLFRLRLVLQEKQGLIFDAVLAEARRRGLLPKKLQLALDSSPVRGRGAVKDAYNLLSDAIGRVVRAVATHVEKNPLDVARPRGLERHLQRGSVKGTRVVDWDDPASVQAFLAELVADCKSALEAAKEAGTATAETELLAKVLEENVVETPAGPQIPQKVPKGRTTSIHDEEMRHGHKSTGKLYTGHKAHVAVDTDSKLVTAIEVSEPCSPEGEHVGSLIEQTEARTESSVREGLGDCAYSTTTAQAQAAEAKVPVITKMPSPPKGRFGPGDFVVSEDGKTAQCPAGLFSAKVGRSKEDLVHRWSPEQCSACPLKERCLYREAKQRSLRVTVGFHERRQREAYAHSPEGREKLKVRTLVEHAIGYLKNLGAGCARYTGRAKTLFQWFACGAVVNLRRLWAAAPAAVPMLLVSLLPLLLLAFSAAPAQAASTSLKSQAVAVVRDHVAVSSERLTAADLSPAVAISRPPQQPIAAAPSHAIAQSRRRLLRLHCSTRGPPDTAPVCEATGALALLRGDCGERAPRRYQGLLSRSAPERFASRPRPPASGGSGARSARPAFAVDRPLDLTASPRSVDGVVALPAVDALRTLRRDGRIRGQTAGPPHVRREGQSHAHQPGAATGSPWAPPVERPTSSWTS